MSTFSWRAAGLNAARFQAYSSLLRIKIKEQADHHAALVNKPHDEEDQERDFEAASAYTQTLTSSDDTRLQAAFQDHIAELISHAKGGKHVAASLLINYKDSVTVVVARNEGLGEADKKFLRRLEKLLNDIARNPEPSVEEALWEEIWKYSALQLTTWIADFQVIAQECVAAWSNAHDNNTNKDLKDQIDLIATWAAWDLQHLRSAIGAKAHKIWRNYNEGDFLTLCNKDPARAKNLRLRIASLGRLVTTYTILLQAAQRFKTFQNLTFVPVVMKTVEKSKTWTLKQTLQSMHLPLEECIVGAIFGPKQTVEALSKAFEAAQKQVPQVHAEVQLLLYAAKSDFGSGSLSSYIGCSKRSCFLCYEFIKIHGGFTTRASIGKMEKAWTIPQVDGLHPGIAAYLQTVLRSVEDDLQMWLRSPFLIPIQHAPEGTLEDLFIVKSIPFLTPIQHKPVSTVDFSSILAWIPFFGLLLAVKRIVQYLLLESAEVRQSAQENNTGYVFVAEPPINHQTTPLLHSNVLQRTGECESCGRKTDQLCPHCGKEFFCSARCAKAERSIYHRFHCPGSSLNTAEHLYMAVMDDVIPDDPQTREDYGFTRCRSWIEISYLLGVYIGLLKYGDLKVETLHEWRCKGVLVQRIITVFSAIPEDARGGYFPWFLRNTHLLETRSDVSRSP